MLNAIIIDDEASGREVLELLLKNHCPEVELVSSVETIPDAINAIKKHNPDIVFLDIRLKNATGFDVLAAPGIDLFDFVVIFTTAYDQYAIQAIKNNAFDYLLKPIDTDELMLTVKKAANHKNQNLKGLLNDLRESINLNPKIKLVTRKGFELIDVSQIIYCKSEANYTRFYLQNGSTKLTSKTLKTYQPILEQNGFIRVHKGHIVNLNEILSYTQGKTSQITMSNNHSLPINKDSKKLLLRKIGM